ncbi:dephospho-CoA kinase [Streptococcus merionis]|uniref:dephospho-CoA kinase n=1 Tax=Streptococcus merionis TaxID=400065 RepID=UPI00351482BF
MSKIIGITGGIASGKSTVVDYLRGHGYTIIDADQVVHELQAKGGKLYYALVDWLGQEILTESGDLNREKLAELIFSNEENKAHSSRIQDAIIREELAARKERLAQEEDLLFMDIPLLYELGYEGWFDAVWVIYVDRKVQLERLMARNGLTAIEAQQRLASQGLLSEKRDRADLVIDNNGRRDETYKQLDKALDALSLF